MSLKASWMLMNLNRISYVGYSTLIFLRLFVFFWGKLLLCSLYWRGSRRSLLCSVSGCHCCSVSASSGGGGEGGSHWIRGSLCCPLSRSIWMVVSWRYSWVEVGTRW